MNYMTLIENGEKVLCGFNPFGEVVQFNILNVFIPKGNPSFERVKQYLSDNNLSAEYKFEWVEKIEDKEGTLLHYNTNLGRFVDTSDNLIATEIKDKIDKGTIEVRKHNQTPDIETVKINIFLPRSFKLNSIKTNSSIKEYIFSDKELDIPVPIKISLLQSIEEEFLKKHIYFDKVLQVDTTGNILRFKINKNEIKKVYKWSKKFLDDYNLDLLNKLEKEEIALFKRRSKGPRTQWYFSFDIILHYIDIFILSLTNRLIGLLNQQAKQSTIGLLSKNQLGKICCIEFITSTEQKSIMPFVSTRDSQIQIFPSELNWDYKPLEQAFNRVNFLFDQALYFESLVVVQAILESIVNGMFDEEVSQTCFKKKEIKWEQKYKELNGYFNDIFDEKSHIKILLNGGLKEIYLYRNKFSHDFLVHKPDYEYDLEVNNKIKKLIFPFIDTWENRMFMGEVETMYSYREKFLKHLLSTH